MHFAPVGYILNENAIDYSKLIKQIATEDKQQPSYLQEQKRDTTEKKSDDQLLHEIEVRLPPEILEKFKNVTSESELQNRYHALYELWKNLNDEKENKF